MLPGNIIKLYFELVTKSIIILSRNKISNYMILLSLLQTF